MRFDKPIGTLLILWPTLWALWLANRGIPAYSLLSIFVLGVFTMRAAGCVINDMADKNIDRWVKRTKDRPLTSGALSLKEAFIIFIILCLIALFLVLQLNSLTVKLSCIALGLAILYPFTKRFFPIPQFFLGLAFAFGLPMAYSASVNQVPLEAWCLYGINILWILAYDTCYAMVDKEDDRKLGIRSSALFFQIYDAAAVTIFQIMFLLALIFWAYYFFFKIEFYICWFLVCLISGYQFLLIKTRQPQLCFRAFMLNHWIGLVIFIGIFFNFSRVC